MTAILAFWSQVPAPVKYGSTVVLVWFLIYAVRRWLPRVWLLVERVLGTKSSLLLTLPSVLAGALLEAILSGGDPKEALMGALMGLLAPLVHHALKSSPLPYQGAVKPTDKESAP